MITTDGFHASTPIDAASRMLDLMAAHLEAVGHDPMSDYALAIWLDDHRPPDAPTINRQSMANARKGRGSLATMQAWANAWRNAGMQQLAITFYA